MPTVHQRHRRTDVRTDGRLTALALRASRGKNHEFVYNKDYPMYKHKTKCAKTWQAIAEELGITGKCDYVNQVSGRSVGEKGDRRSKKHPLRFFGPRRIPRHNVHSHNSVIIQVVRMHSCEYVPIHSYELIRTSVRPPALINAMIVHDIRPPPSHRSSSSVQLIK